MNLPDHTRHRAIGVDFDGVIHTYDEGWKDGTIYGDLIPHTRAALQRLMDEYAVFIHTSRDIDQVARWLTERGFTVATDHDQRFWDTANVLLVTSHKYPALAYIDDRAIRFDGWVTALDELDLHLDVDPHLLVDHAQRELQLCGQTTEDPTYARALVDTVRAFTSYGHSGGSADVAIDQLTRLLQHKNLAPLTSDPTEWEDRSEQTGRPFWQNRRNSTVFSEDSGRTWWTTERDPITELAEAIRLTREYVGADMLPAIEGWSWYDALTRHAPDILGAILDSDNAPPPRVDPSLLADSQKEDAAPPSPATPNVYRERAHLVAHLAALHPAALSYSDPTEPDWPVATITTPTGQMTWHISPTDLDLFEHVPVVHPSSPEATWDGHTTEKKYDRLRALTASTNTKTRPQPTKENTGG